MTDEIRKQIDERLKASAECFINSHVRAFNIMIKEIESEDCTTVDQVMASLKSHIAVFEKLRIKEGLA